jgi:hypothetical protein
MSDIGMDVETTGGYRVPLDNWNDLANYLAMQRVRLTRPFYDRLMLLRSLEPEYHAWQAAQRKLTEQWMHGTAEPRP